MRRALNGLKRRFPARAVLITVVHQFHDFSVGTMIETVSAAEAAAGK